MTPDRPLLIIDFSNLVHIAWWPAISAYEADSKYDPRKTVLANVDGKLRRIREMLARSGILSPEVVFVEDRFPMRKAAAFPAYRKSRKHTMPDDIKPLVKAHLQVQHLVWSEDNEADDTIASLVRQSVGRAIVIVTTDKDLWQTIGDTVRVYNTTKDRFVTPEDVEEKFGVSRPDKIPLTKALWGDAGDDVPNLVPRMQKHLLPLIEASDGTLDDFLRLYDAATDLTPRCRELVDATRSQIAVNWSLVKLDPSCKLSFEKPEEHIR